MLFTAWKTAPRKLGLTYCFQRPCGVFAARVPHVLTPAARDEGNGSVPSLGDDVTATATAGACAKSTDEPHSSPLPYQSLHPSHPSSQLPNSPVPFRPVSLTPHRTVARCPSISACGSLLAFLSCREGADTHWTTVSLIMQRLDCDAVLARGGDEEEKGPLLPEAVACPVVDEPLITDGGDPFSGLYTVALHPRAVQLEKGFVVLDTVCGSRGSVVTVPIPDSGAFHTPKQFEAVSEGSQDLARHVSVVAPDRIGSYALLDVSDSNGMLLSHSSPSTPATLVWHTPQGAWVRDPSPAPIPSAFRDLEWEVITITPSKPSGATDNDFEAVLVYPTEQGRAKACEEGASTPSCAYHYPSFSVSSSLCKFPDSSSLSRASRPTAAPYPHAPRRPTQQLRVSVQRRDRILRRQRIRRRAAKLPRKHCPLRQSQLGPRRAYALVRRGPFLIPF